MKGKKSESGIGTVVVLTTAGLANLVFGGVAEADQNYIDIWNYSFDIDKGQEIKVKENANNASYIRGDPRELRIYGWGPTNGNPTSHELKEFGIDPNRAYILEFRFEAETAPNNIDNAIDLNYWEGVEGSGSPLQRKERNFFMRRAPSSPSTANDPNIYDLLDLTNNFTQNAQIWLPDITSSTPRSPTIYDKWQKIVSNYADLAPSVFDGNLPDGKVNFADFAVFAAYWQRTDANETNNWHKGADLNRDGNVDIIDLSSFCEQWLCDPNTISNAIRFLPKEYMEALNKKARQILDYTGKHRQKVICKLYQTSPDLGLAGDYMRSNRAQELFYGKEKAAQLREEALSNRRVQLAKNYIRGIDHGLFEKKSNLSQLLTLSNNNHNGHLQRHYETIDHKLLNQRSNRLLSATQNRKNLYRA